MIGNLRNYILWPLPKRNRESAGRAARGRLTELSTEPGKGAIIAALMKADPPHRLALDFPELTRRMLHHDRARAGRARRAA
jgi:hypothetical protein